MMYADKQQLTEIIEMADVAVRVASQLRLKNHGRSIRDTDSIQKANDFLSAAISGGEFMTGKVQSLNSTLRPLNWAADIRLGLDSPADSSKGELEEYGELVESLQAMQQVLSSVRDGIEANASDQQETINFFQTLSEYLGTVADQASRPSSTALATF